MTGPGVTTASSGISVSVGAAMTKVDPGSFVGQCQRALKLRGQQPLGNQKAGIELLRVYSPRWVLPAIHYMHPRQISANPAPQLLGLATAVIIWHELLGAAVVSVNRMKPYEVLMAAVISES